MESFSGDTEESTEDTEGRKKSKLKLLKSRLFGRSKKTATARNAKLSQSASDIAAGKGLGSDEDLACSQGTMGSRALSHDSIFLADQVLTDPAPAKVLSQENVQSKIKSLQMKLQQQKLRLGPPPLVPPIRHPDELVTHLETDCIPHSPTETSGGDTTSQSDIGKTISPSSSSPLSTIPKPALTRSVPLVPSLPLPFVTYSSSPSSAVEPPVDFSSPAHITSCLDNSAARHRMSIKPRNQRASTRRRLVATDSRTYSHTLNNINQPEYVKEDEQHTEAQDEAMLETEQAQTDSPVPSQPSKYPEVAPTTPESAPKSPLLTPQQDNPFSGTLPPVTSQVLQVKSHRAVDVRERPRSAFIESELKDKSEGGFETQLMSHDKRSAQIKTVKTDDSSEEPPSTFASLLAFRSSSFHKQERGEIEGTKELRRPGQRSGSLHFSITTAKAKDGERSRSGSFVEPLEQREARNKAIVRTDDKPFSGLKEKDEVKDLKPRGGVFATGRLRQEESPPKSSVLPWERRDSSKKIESAKTSKDVATDAGPEESDSNQEVVEEAVEAKEVQEEEGQTRTFGVKLRPTSQSIRFRSDASSIRQSKPPVCEEQGDKPKEEELGNNVSCTSKKLPTNISGTPTSPGDVRLTDAAPSGSSLPGKNNIPATGDPRPMPAEIERKSSNLRQLENPIAEPQEPPTPPQPAPQPATQTVSPEVSWVSLALEKTKSLHQLFSKLPRDFSAMQTTLRPQARAQSANPTETQNGAQMETQTVKKQLSATSVQTVNMPTIDTFKAEMVQITSPTQAVKPAQTPVQQKAPTTTSGLSFREPQIAKQVFEPQSSPQCLSHPPVQTSPWTSQSPLRSLTQTETTSQSPQGTATQPVAQPVLILGQHEPLQQSTWSNRSIIRTSQFRPTTSVPTTSSATTSSPLPTSGRGEKEASSQEKEGSSQPIRRTWGASVSERAAVLEKQADWTSPSGTKGLELRKPPTDVQAPSEMPGSINTTAVSKDTKQELREGEKPAESSPIKVPERTREDRWQRKNVTSSSPSSSPIQPSALQSVSESGQPSWMELAKRKSMAWNDRTMD